MREPLFMDAFGKTYEMYFHKRTDSVEGLGLLCKEDDFVEPWCDVVISTEGCAANEGYVKNYSENAGLDKWLEDNGVAEPTGKVLQTGFVIIPQYRFNMEMVNKHTW